MKKRRILDKRIILLLGMSLFFSSLIFAGPNEDAGITFDLDATTYGNQNLLQIPTPNQGSYIRIDIYAQDVVNLDTYEFEVIYNQNQLDYITATATNPITYEENILTSNGGTAIGWMIDTSIPGVLSIAYTLAGTDTLEAPEGEGLIAHVVFQTMTNESTYLSFGNVYYHDSSGIMDEITSTVVALLGGLAPMPPADLTAYTDTVLHKSIRLTWIDPTENADGTPLEDLAGINIYYADDTYIASVNPGVETYAVQGLSIGEYCSFYVTAYDNETPINESMPGNTAATMVIAPMPPSDFSAYSDYTTTNSIQLTWTDPTENIDGSPLTDLNHIDVYYSDGTLIASVNPGIETYTDVGLTDGQLYSYYLVAVADNSNGRYYSVLFTISLTDQWGNGWNDSMIDVLVNDVVVLDDITIASGIGPEDHTFPVSEGDSVFVDYITYTGSSYTNAYYVYDNVGDLIVSSGVGGTMPSDVSFIAAPKPFYNTTDTLSWHAGGSPIPSPPEKLDADAISGDIITLTWDDPTTQVDGTPLDDLACINIYFADSTLITSVDPGVETYTFTDLISGQYYSFYAIAYDNEIPVNESGHSNTSGCYNTTLLYVHPDSTFNSIQAALNFCTHHDTVLVAAGTYYENINWPTYGYGAQGTNSIHLISESGPNTTIIDGDGETVIVIDDYFAEIYIDSTTIIEGFTVRNGGGTHGAGIACVNGVFVGASPTIRGNIITQNNGRYGGIRAHGSPPIITDNNISQNNTNGIYLRYWANATITGNTIYENGNCGIFSYYFFPSFPTIIGNIITHNGSNGMEIGPGTLIDNNVIANNDSLGIGTGTTGGTAHITNCIITGNLSGGIGGGSSKNISNCVVSNNAGVGIAGTGWQGSVTINDCVISNNAGNGVNHGGECYIHYCDITDNTGFGLYNSSGGCGPQYITQAQNNWWGDPGGPFGPNGNGVSCLNGSVEDWIHYTPWLTEPSILTIVSVPDFSCGEPGETITIPVNTTDITGDEVLSAEFTLSYDSSIITAIDIDATGTLLSGTDWTWQYSVVGDTLFVEMSGTDVLTGIGTLINLVFEVEPDAQLGQQSPLHFEDFIFNEGILQVYTVDGIFIVGQIFGAIEGTVTEATRNPISGAVVTALCSYFTYCDTTDANGYYLMPEALSTTYDMTVTASGYNEIDTTGVVVIGGEITQVNFQLTHPEIVVEPASIDVELPVDITYDTNIVINNPGNGPLDFTISIGEGARFVKSIEINPGGTNPIQPRCEALLGSTQESMNTGDLFGTFQLAPNSQSGTLEPWQGFPPSLRDEVTIHYDGEPYTGIGLTAGGTYEGAIRLTPDELAPYDGWELISALFYHFESGEHSGNIKIYDAGSSSEPGALITSEPYSVTGQTWFRTDLETPVTIDATQDLWTSVEITHLAGEYPIGCDAGPAVQGKGDFLWYLGGGWNELYLVGMDNNWNIRAIVTRRWLSVTPDYGTVPAGQSIDITVHFDTYTLTPDSTYTTSILIHNNSADSPVNVPVTMHIASVGVDDSPTVFSTKLNPNFPNPFNPETAISFSIKEDCRVTIDVYNIKGQKVKTLINEELNAGAHQVIWHGKDENGKSVSSGIYFYKMDSGKYTSVKKMILMK